MKSYRCPVCKKPLTKPEWERAFKIHESQEQHLRTQKGNCRRKNANCVSGSLKPRARERRKNSDELSDFSPNGRRPRKDHRARAGRAGPARAETAGAGGPERLNPASVVRRPQRVAQADLGDRHSQAGGRAGREEGGTTPQTEGLEFEERLAARLQRESPEDDVQHKGKGCDVLHYVTFEEKQAGVIVYECKRTRRVQGQHVQQANRAKQMFNADFAVLVTSGRTKRFGGFDDMHGVLVISPLGVVALQACCESI